MVKKINLNSVLKYLIASLLVIIPLYPKFPFIRIPGIYVSVRLEDFLVAALALVSFYVLLPRVKFLLKDNLIRAILIYFLVGFTSLLSGIFLTKTVELSVGFFHFFRRIEYIVPFFAVLAYFLIKKEKSLDFFVKILCLVIFIVFLYGLGQRYFDFPVIITQNEEYSKGIALKWIPGSHISSTFGGHYDLASFLVLVMPIIISLFFIYKDKFSKAIFLVVFLSGFWLLVNSVSRISFVSYLLGTSLSLILLKKYKEVFFVLALSITLSFFSPSLFARYQRVIQVILKSSIPSIEVLAVSSEPTATPAPEVFEDRSTSIRLNVEWPRAIRAFSKNSLLGTGYSSIGLATDNDYLRALGESGALGLAAFALIIFRLGQVLIKPFPLINNFKGIELGFVAGVIGGSVGILLNAFFIDIFEASKFALMFWLFVGFTVQLIKNNQNEQKI